MSNEDYTDLLNRHMSAVKERYELYVSLKTLLSMPLRDVYLDRGAIEAWLHCPTELLSGEIPVNVVITDPERAYRAAKRYATRIQEIMDRTI